MCKSKYQSVAAHEDRIQGVLRRAFGDDGLTLADDRTPLDDLIAKEVDFDMMAGAPEGEWGWPNDADEKVRLVALKREEAAEVAMVARRELVWWIAGAGVHPFKVCQRFYGLCWQLYPDVVGSMRQSWLAEILGESRASFQIFVKTLFGDKAEFKLGQSIKVGGQKSAEASAKYAENAQKHCPKRQLGGDAGEDGELAREALLKVERLDAERLRMLRGELARKELADDAESMRLLAERTRLASRGAAGAAGAAGVGV